MPHPAFEPLRLRQLLSSRKAGWALALLLGWVTLLAVLSLLAVSGWFITASAIAGLLSAGAAWSFDFFRPAALIRLAAITRTAGRYAERLSSHHAALGLLKDLRCRLFSKLALSPFDATPGSASQQHRLLADIDLLDQFPLSFVAPWFWASSLLLLLLAFAAWLAPALFWMILPGLLLAWLLLPLQASLALTRLARTDADQAEQRRVLLLEALQLRASLVLWGQWQRQWQGFSQVDTAHLEHQLRQQQLSSRLLLLQQLVLGLTLTGLLWQALPLLEQGNLSLPWLVALLLALLAFQEILAPLTSSFMALGLSQAARDRLNALGAAQPEPPPQPLQLDQQPLTLTLQGITARHPGAATGPQAISLNLKAGEVLLITGPSGLGKSSLLEVITGHLQPQQGQCLLNGQIYTAAAIRPHLGYLQQQFDLFNLTLAENLRLGQADADDQALWQVLETVGLKDWAKAQPLQLKTPLGEYALQVSGGQARRIALARLLLQPKPLLLLDEPFAGLDATTSQQLLQHLLEHQSHGILVLVSHQWPQGLQPTRHLQLT